jgi:AraC family transcriptional regulator, exoenzyme S synthesis regulatory protein ExsA
MAGCFPNNFTFECVNDTLMIRFPTAVTGSHDKFLLAIDNKPLAKYNKVDKATGKQTGFLTEHTLFFIIQGEKLLHFQDKTITIQSNELILLKKGIYVISENIPEGGAFEALMIFVSDKFLKEFYYSTIATESTEANDTSLVIFQTNDILDSFKLQYLHYFGKSFKSLKQILQIKLHEIFLLLLSTKSQPELLSFIRSSVDNKEIDLDFIVQKYLFQPVTVNELANLSGRSLATFKRDFQKKYSASPKQWINQRRLAHAHMLLENTNENISEIAYTCGFENVSHFNKLFRKEYKIVPTALRAKSVSI